MAVAGSYIRLPAILSTLMAAVGTSFRSLGARLAPTLSPGDIFPDLEQEFGEYRRYLRGRVLNAGAGHRDISSMVNGTLINQDIETGLHNDNIDVYSPLDDIPFEDAYFDAIICNAVLEHVADPAAVMSEFARVCRPGGLLYLVVPFMQPEHLDPTDFQRYTRDGLARLCETHGFGAVRVEGVHSVYVTLAWIVAEWLRDAPGARGTFLRLVLFPYLKRKARTSTEHVHSLASAYRAIAVRLPES
jgi:SAM-dependent methyltransferase